MKQGGQNAIIIFRGANTLEGAREAVLSDFIIFHQSFL